MNPERDEERAAAAFCAGLDALLAGEEPAAPSDPDALRMAEVLAGARWSRASRVRSSLRARLLGPAASAPAVGLVPLPARPWLQAAFAAAAVLLVVWGARRAPPRPGPAAAGPGPAAPGEATTAGSADDSATLPEVPGGHRSRGLDGGLPPRAAGPSSSRRLPGLPAPPRIRFPTPPPDRVLAFGAGFPMPPAPRLPVLDGAPARGPRVRVKALLYPDSGGPGVDLSPPPRRGGPPSSGRDVVSTVEGVERGGGPGRSVRWDLEGAAIILETRPASLDDIFETGNL